MTLHSYYSNSGKDLILDYVNNLPENEKSRWTFCYGVYGKWRV